MPPALVETSPPIVAEPLPPSVSGKRRPLARRGLVQRLQDHAGLAGRPRARCGIERADRVHPPQRQQQRVAARVGRRAAATCRCCRPAARSGRRARAHSCTSAATSRGRGGRGQRQRAPGEAAAPVGQPRLHQLGVAGQAALRRAASAASSRKAVVIGSCARAMPATARGLQSAIARVKPTIQSRGYAGRSRRPSGAVRARASLMNSLPRPARAARAAVAAPRRERRPVRPSEHGAAAAKPRPAMRLQRCARRRRFASLEEASPRRRSTRCGSSSGSSSASRPARPALRQHCRRRRRAAPRRRGFDGAQDRQCVPIDGIAGGAARCRGNRLLLFMRDRRLLSASAREGLQRARLLLRLLRRAQRRRAALRRPRQAAVARRRELPDQRSSASSSPTRRLIAPAFP